MVRNLKAPQVALAIKSMRQSMRCESERPFNPPENPQNPPIQVYKDIKVPMIPDNSTKPNPENEYGHEEET